MLIVMRLAEMRRIHPQQIVDRCARCREQVGIYPSGQNVLREHPGTEVVCNRCSTAWIGSAGLAPGARDEPAQSIANPNRRRP